MSVINENNIDYNTFLYWMLYQISHVNILKAFNI